MVECSQSCELISYNVISAGCADKAKRQYSKFLSTIVVEDKNAFLHFNIAEDRIDSFYFTFTAGPTFKDLFELVTIVLILSHGQAAVERDFSVNEKLLIENLHTESLTAQRLVYDHMKCHNLEPFTIPITSALLSHVKQARKRYFESQEERAKNRIKSTREETIEEIEKEMSSINQQSMALNKTIEELKVTSDKYSFDAEKRNDVAEIKSDIAKSNEQQVINRWYSYEIENVDQKEGRILNIQILDHY